MSTLAAAFCRDPNPQPQVLRALVYHSATVAGQRPDCVNGKKSEDQEEDVTKGGGAVEDAKEEEGLSAGAAAESSPPPERVDRSDKTTASKDFAAKFEETARALKTVAEEKKDSHAK